MSINACNTKVSMLFSLLLASIRILSCFFFLFFVMPSNLSFLLLEKKIRVKLAPTIPIGAPTTLTEKTIQTPPLVALKTIKTLSA